MEGFFGVSIIFSIIFLPQSCQSHTVFRNWPMSTRLVFISSIHGCSNMRHGVARRLPSFSRLILVSQLQIKDTSDANSPALDEVFEVLAPFELVFRLILEFRDRLPDNVCQKINETSPRIHLCAVCGKWKSVLRHLQKCHTQ